MVSQDHHDLQATRLKEKKNKIQYIGGNWGRNYINTAKLYVLPVKSQSSSSKSFHIAENDPSPHRKLNLLKTTANTQGRKCERGNIDVPGLQVLAVTLVASYPM